MSDGPTAALLQQIFEIDPLACSACHDAMRIVAFITQTSVIDQILAHFRARTARESHAGPLSPYQRGPTRAGARHTPSARPPTPRPPHEYAPLERPATPWGRSAFAALPPARPIGPHRLRPPRDHRRSHGAHGARARRRARRRPSRGAGEVTHRAVCSTNRRPTPIEIPIPIARAAYDGAGTSGLRWRYVHARPHRQARYSLSELWRDSARNAGVSRGI